jgi:hypothetical protein
MDDANGEQMLQNEEILTQEKTAEARRSEHIRIFFVVHHADIDVCLSDRF